MKTQSQYIFNYEGLIKFDIKKSTITSIEDEDKMPKECALSQNYPNPFNPVTTIKYQLPKDVKVSLTIYNLNGQLVETLISEHQEAGYYTVQWDASNVGSGVYFYRINAGDPSSGSGRVFTDVKKCIVIK